MSALIIGLSVANVVVIVWAPRSVAVAVRRVADMLYQAIHPGAGALERSLDPADRFDPNSLK